LKIKLAVSVILLILLTSVLMATFKIAPATTMPDSPETREVSRPIQLTTNSSYDRDACFLEDQYGTWWLFFTRGRGDPSALGYNPDNDFYDIYYLKSTDQGATWTEYSMPSHVNDPYGQREVAAYEIPEIHTIVVFFTDAFYGDPYGTPTYGAYYTYTNNNGTTWATVRQVPDVTAYHIDAINAYGKRWLFFEGPGALIYVTYLTGSTWSTPIQISESGKHGGIPKAMIDDDGNFNVVWCGWSEGGIYRATSADGISWSTPQLILTSSYVACDPVLTQDSDGTYWLFWAPWDSATDSQWLEVVYSADGTTWSSSIHVTSGGYGGNYWWDMWPEAYRTPEGDMLLFYTSEVATGSYVKGDGNIWMFEVIWNLTNNHYEFIQNAIDAAISRDTILVYDGIYHEALYLEKSLEIVSASMPTIIGSKLFATDYGNREAVIFVKNAEDVVIEGFDIKGEGLGPARNYGVLYQNSSGAVRNCIISPNTVGDMGSVGIAGISRANLTVESCIIKNFGRIGVYATNVESIVISENEIIGQTYDQDNLVNYGIEIEDYDGASTAKIIGNEIYNCDNTHPSPLWSSAAIIIDIWRMFYDLPPSTVSIEENIICDNYEAIEIVSSPLSYAHHNNIYNNRYGVYVNPDLYGNNATFDARFNWWGHESGPSGSGPGLGDSIGDYVAYSPWLGYPFEIVPMTYHVDPTGKIQDAIDDASPGDTIKVHEGNYTEQLIINKSLTLIGDPGPKIIAPDVRSTFTIPESGATWDPIIFAYGSLTGSETISVTIEGFEIDGGNKAASSYRYVAVLLRNVKPGIVFNNTIHSLYPPSGTGKGPQTFGILVYGDSEVTISHNEIRDFSRGGIGITGDAGPGTDPSAVIEQNTVFGNGFEAETGWWAENGIQVGYGATALIQDNKVYDCTVNNPDWAATGILIVDTEEGAIVSNNYIEGCDIGIGAVDFPGSVYGSPWDYHILSNVIITRNTLIGNTWQIDISNDARNITVTYNDIINATEDGIDVWSYVGDVYPTNVEIHYNNIEGSGSYGIWASEELEAAPVNATFNWWGDPTGPYHNTSWTHMGSPYGPHYGLGDNVSNYVLYDPWLEQYYPTRDVAIVEVVPSKLRIAIGETIQVNVTVRNEGNAYSETFDVKLYYDSNLIGTQTVTNLALGATEKLTFSWDTTGLTPGDYTLTAIASTVPDETDFLDNSKSVEIRAGYPPTLNVVPSIVEAGKLNKTFSVDLTIDDLGEYWEVIGVEFRLSFNDTLLEVVNVTEGPFMQQFGTTFFIGKIEPETPLYSAHVLIGIVLLPPYPPEEFPHGSGVLATITFKIIYQEKSLNPETTPPLTCDLELFIMDHVITSPLVDLEKQRVPCNLGPACNYKIYPNHKADVNWDYYVGIDDITYTAEHFGSDPETWPERWDPECDVNGDNYVGIDDVVMVASNFGWTSKFDP